MEQEAGIELNGELPVLVPPVWEKAFEVNPAKDDAVRAACVEFVLAGLYAGDRISRSERHGRITYET
jgi:magnesium chelatase subunit I